MRRPPRDGSWHVRHPQHVPSDGRHGRAREQRPQGRAFSRVVAFGFVTYFLWARWLMAETVIWILVQSHCHRFSRLSSGHCADRDALPGHPTKRLCLRRERLQPAAPSWGGHGPGGAGRGGESPCRQEAVSLCRVPCGRSSRVGPTIYATGTQGPRPRTCAVCGKVTAETPSWDSAFSAVSSLHPRCRGDSTQHEVVQIR